MTDRLRDLKRGGQTSISIDGSYGSKDDGSVSSNGKASLLANDVLKANAPPAAASAGSKALSTQFFSDLDTLKKHINQIKEASVRVSDLTQETILATSNEKESELSAEINPLIAETNKKGMFSKKLLQALKEEAGKIDDPQDQRIRKTLLDTLTRKFVEVMKGYQQAQAKYKTEITKKAKRQVQIVKPDATEEEVDAVVRSGGADQLIQASILKGEASQAVKDMCNTVSQKYNEILLIEKSVMEMHQMFVDLALIVETQGELLDSIEFQVKQTIEYVEEGNVQLAEAIQIQKNLRKRQCYCLLFVLVVIGVIIMIVMLKAKATSTSN